MNNTKWGKRYFSFEDIATNEFNLKPLKRQTNDKQKLTAQREKFVGTCPYCKEQLHYSYGTNIVSCVNEKCKGKKIVIKDKDGENITMYKPYYRILQGENSSTIGTIIFDEKE